MNALYQFPRVPTFGPGLAAQLGITERPPLPRGVRLDPHRIETKFDRFDDGERMRPCRCCGLQKGASQFRQWREKRRNGDGMIDKIDSRCHDCRARETVAKQAANAGSPRGEYRGTPERREHILAAIVGTMTIREIADALRPCDADPRLFEDQTRFHIRQLHRADRVVKTTKATPPDQSGRTRVVAYRVK